MYFISDNRALNRKSMSSSFVVARNSFAGAGPLGVIAHKIAKSLLVFFWPIQINAS